jgi:hypothetical protein
VFYQTTVAYNNFGQAQYYVTVEECDTAPTITNNASSLPCSSVKPSSALGISGSASLTIQVIPGDPSTLSTVNQILDAYAGVPASIQVNTNQN